MPNQYPTINNKVVIVTGAAKGIGRAIAERFGAAGARVVVNDVEEVGGTAVSHHITQQGGTALFCHADVADKSQVDALFDQTMAQFGRVDVLVNNAAIVSPNLHF
ncbi:MAG: SDR family NAD(P)-dependent oxidoreductase, partial [Anaerolineales bacterium]|nr:SDR family NAD(P)-dependent oxidoreductase [Anaerolineales bacterium]